MKRPRHTASSLLLTGLLLAGCAGIKPGAPAAGWTDFPITDFEAVHSPVNADGNVHLIFGAIPISKPAAGLSPDLAVFLGRWEGYDYSPPVKKDAKGVLVIQEIGPEGGKACLWSGTNLQYPYWVKEFRFKVLSGSPTTIEWEGELIGPGGAGGTGTFRFAYDPESHQLRGGINTPRDSLRVGSGQLSRGRTFVVYKDYPAYLAGKRIYAGDFHDARLGSFGGGYLAYLPDGYEADTTKSWPLILFLHGSGDRGDNVLLLPKASPFMYIREKGPLPCLIVAPLLSRDYPLFPGEYMAGVLGEVEARYRVDPERVYVTGLSIGGEAAYRFAVERPNTFAALAPLSAFSDTPTAARMGRIKDVPVWAIHGADDTVVPLSKGRQPIDALKEAGGNARFTVLPGHDHDIWTDTYSDPAFYDWLLRQERRR